MSETTQAQAAAPSEATAAAVEKQPGAEAPETLEGLLAAMSAPAPKGEEGAEQPGGAEGDEPEAASGEQGDDPAEGDELGAGEEEDDPTGPVEGKKAKNFRGRWDHLNEEERRVIELTTRKGLSLAEAQRVVYGDAPKEKETQQQAKAAAAEDPLGQIDGEIATHEKQLDELEAQLEDEFATAEDRRRLNKELRTATVKLAELRADRKIAEREQERSRQEAEASEKGAIQEQWQASLTEAQRLYPGAFEDGSDFAEEVGAEVEYLRATGSPLVQNPRFPVIVISRIARQRGIARQAPEAAAPASAGGQKPNRGVRPVPPGGVPAATKTPSLDERMAGAKSADEMLALMREYGTPIEELARR